MTPVMPQVRELFAVHKSHVSRLEARVYGGTLPAEEAHTELMQMAIQAQLLSLRCRRIAKELIAKELVSGSVSTSQREAALIERDAEPGSGICGD